MKILNERLKNFGLHLEALSLSDSTIYQYKRYTKLLHNVMIKTGYDLNRKTIEAFVSVYNNPVCRATLREYINFFKYNLEVPRSRGAKPRKIKNYISQKEIIRLSKWMNEHHTSRKYSLMLKLSYYCGLRRKEILNIHLMDFDWEVWNEDTNLPCKLKISKLGAKRKKERYIVVPPILAMSIWKYVRKMRAIGSRDYDKFASGEKPLFTIKRTRWNNVFKTAVKKCLSKDYTLHELRFSRATYWFEKGFTLIEVRDLLGHEEITTTERYIQKTPEKTLVKLAKSLIKKN